MISKFKEPAHQSSYYGCFVYTQITLFTRSTISLQVFNISRYEMPEQVNHYYLPVENLNANIIFQQLQPTANLTKVNLQTVEKNDQQKDRKPCNCNKSKCLKLYCECFGRGELCTPSCKCKVCFNKKGCEVERQKAIEACRERNPNAFNQTSSKIFKYSRNI